MSEVSHYDEIILDENKVAAFMKQQLSAETLTMFGPTSSAKSTCTTELLPPSSNKLLGKNVGDAAQTSLIPTMLMLNSRFKDDEVLIQCIRRKGSLIIDFMDSVKTVITNSLYVARDDLDELTVDVEVIRQILDPVNRMFHVYQYANAHRLIQSLESILSSVYTSIIEEPDYLDKAANALFRKSRLKNPKFKKKDAYDQIVDERLSANIKVVDALKHWYCNLESTLMDELHPLWLFPKSFTLLDRLSDGCAANKLMDMLYGQESACSLVFEEVRYATSPSSGFKDEYKNKYAGRPGRTVKINIVDTVGLTQTSQNSEDISDNIDAILKRDSDALLFLCASDEQPTVYDTCISLLNEKQKELKTKPITICRSKADIIIRNIMMNNWRRDTGTNNIPDGSKEYAEYLNNAFEAFLSLQIDNPALGETLLGKIGDIQKIEYLSTAPDLTLRMNEFLENKLSPTRIFKIVLDLAQKVDKMYAISGKTRLWLQSTDLLQYPLNAIYNATPLAKTIALAMTAKNNQDSEQQYHKYVKAVGTYHGRSVNCFRHRLSNGVGHETNASVYLNFRLFLTSMVARWLRDVVPMNDLINNFDVSFDYLHDTEQAAEAKKDIPLQFKQRLRDNWEYIIGSVARRLAYDCLAKDFEQSYHFGTWDEGFRKSLDVIHRNFSSEEYWQENIVKHIIIEGQELLQKMYIYD